ncbi:MAG: hypothetical protein F6J95_007685 [Leptolyngbya sp. SIO1E4]|nr:hypothetical protein [Leptolyngbya sp. SIO1E4]
MTKPVQVLESNFKPPKKKPYRNRALETRTKWQCVAHIQGRLRRGADRKSLFFQTHDSVLFPVDSVAREDPKSLIWLIANIDRAMNQENLWCVYPKAQGRSTVLTPAAIVQNKADINEDILRFSANIGNIDLERHPSNLPLFIGRNRPPFRHHFLNIRIPADFSLPDLAPRTPVQGQARRVGDEFELTNLNAS